MTKEFHQTVWDESLDNDWEAILRLAIAEDLGHDGDWTTRSLVDPRVIGRAAVAARQTGVVAGLLGVAITLSAIEPRLHWSPRVADGAPVEKGTCIGVVEGPASGLLTSERILLNLLGRLSGIATLTRRYVDAVAGTKARIYDTRKTTPGWRRLEKYAVRCGGGWNHRGGLFEAVLIKDNHLALGSQADAGLSRFTPAEAVQRAREFVAAHTASHSGSTTRTAAEMPAADMIVEVEVDTLEQLDGVLPASPDIVLLDNMDAATLRKAVARRDACNPAIELEASGGVNMDTVRQIAEAGVDRISIGALTHSAISLDFGLDWSA